MALPNFLRLPTHSHTLEPCELPVPQGIQPGQPFTFKVAAPAAPVMAQPVMAQPVMAQPVMAQPMMAAPVMGQPMMAQQPTMIQQPGGDPMPPPGAPPGGVFFAQQYCGDQTCLATIIVALFFWPAVCCVPACKCDQRLVYKAPNGVLYLENGAQAPPDCCEC